MVDDFKNKNILIVGLGLMGGSIAKALKRKDIKSIIAIDKDKDVLESAQVNGVIEKGFVSSEDALTNADFVVIGLYPELAVKFINENEKLFKKGCVITDICGVKQPVVEGVNITRSDITFVPAHPMAGSERQGYGCSFPTLFDGCNYIITPLDTNSEEAIEQVKNFAKVLGAKNIVMSTPEKHDEYIAFTSQIPHALAIAYMHESKGRDVMPYAGGSFRDVSRVASINEVMWAELFCENSRKLTTELKSIRAGLEVIIDYIDSKDTKALREYMKVAADTKENYDAENSC
jgi:prephenate dehydrogenase